MSQAPEDGPLHTLGLLEELREECKSLWGTSSEFYFRIDNLLRQLANPNLHDIPMRLPFRVKLWDRHDQHIRWVKREADTPQGHSTSCRPVRNAAIPSERTAIRGSLARLGSPRNHYWSRADD